MNKFYKGYDDIAASASFKQRMVRTLQSETKEESIETTGRLRFRAARIAAIAAAVLVLAIGTVFAIPSARAEVLSWFGVTTPRDYLAADENERAKNPELNELVTSPNENGVVLIPIDRTDSEAVNSPKALEVSDFLYKNADITLGDAMFDGEEIHQSIRLKGLSGLYLLEQWTGGNVTAVPVDPAAVVGMYEEIEEAYRTGEKMLYERPESWLIYEMQDGTRFYGFLELAGTVNPAGSVEQYIVGLREKGIKSTDTEAVNAENEKYLADNELTAVAEIMGENCLKYADADGKLTAKVYYSIKVIEEDRGNGEFVPETELFYAELGTITVDLNAYRNLEQNGLEGMEDSVVWGAETVMVSTSTAYDEDGLFTDRLTFTKHLVSMEGVVMCAEPGAAVIDALGIRNINIRINMPESWTEAERAALADSLEFEVLINGEKGRWYPQYVACDVQEDGSILWFCDHIEEVPYDLLNTVKTISFVPTIRANGSIRIIDKDGNVTETLNPAYGETVISQPGVDRWDSEIMEVAYPQYTVTLNVQ